jgi:gephyrin
MFISLLKEHSLASDIRDYGIVTDQGLLLDEILTKATSECDLVITSGGVSMGEFDLVKPYLEIKGEVFFGRLNMKPGKPTTFAKVGKCLVFSLPGNPVSSFVTAELFVVPAAKIMSGLSDTSG